MIVVDARDLRELLQEVGGAPVLTLYIPVDPSSPVNHRDAGSRPWEVQLRNDVTGLTAQLRSDARFEAARDAALTWLDGYQPSGRTLVLFSDGDRVIDIELPVVLQQRAAYGRPLVGELARAISEHRLYTVVLVDSEHARMVGAALGFVNDVAILAVDSRWGEPGATRSGHMFKFESRREEYQHKYHRTVAEQVDRLVADFPEVDRLVLGGIEVEAHGVARALGKRTSRALVGVVPMPVSSSDAAIMERIEPLAEQVERDADWAVVSGLRSAAGAGRAVFGLPAVEAALASGVVQELVVSSHAQDTEVVEDVVAGALSAGAAVTFVHAEAAEDLDPTDGVAARLYYAAVIVP